ncbi:MAG: response regulator transcription factor [Chloroflexota bacterium]|nr:response regulator transcription factor [Chloroflexota bacterium]
MTRLWMDANLNAQHQYGMPVRSEKRSGYTPRFSNAPLGAARELMTSIAIVDDHHDFAEKLRSFIEEQPGCVLAGVAGDAVTGLAVIHATRPDLVLIDVGLPDRNGFWLAERVAELGLGSRVVLMSGSESPEYAQAASTAGALAFIPKMDISQQLPVLLREIATKLGPTDSAGRSPFVPNTISSSGIASLQLVNGPILSVAQALSQKVTRDQSLKYHGALAGLAYFGGLAAGEPLAGLIGATGLLLLSYWQHTFPRAFCGRAGQDGLWRVRRRTR